MNTPFKKINPLGHLTLKWGLLLILHCHTTTFADFTNGPLKVSDCKEVLVRVSSYFSETQGSSSPVLYRYRGEKDPTWWEMVDKETLRILKRNLPTETPEELETWVKTNISSLNKIKGALTENWLFGEMGYHRDSFIPGSSITVGGKSHADGWHVQLRGDGKLVLTKLSESKSSLQGYLHQGRFQIQGFLSRLLEAKAIQVKGQKISPDSLLMETLEGPLSVLEIKQRYGKALLSKDWFEFEHSFKKVFGPDFYEVIVPSSSSQSPQKKQEGFLKLSTISEEEIEKRLMLYFKAVGLVPQISNFSINSFLRQASYSSSKQLESFLSRVLYDEKGAIIPKYKGVEGMLEFADAYYLGNLGASFQAVSKLYGLLEIKRLGWGKGFPGSVEEYRSMRHELTSSEGKKKYGGGEGYLTYAEVHGMDLMKAYKRASAVLSSTEMKALGWGKKFPGSVEAYRSMRHELTSSEGKKKYEGAQGYLAYAEIHGMDLTKAYKRASAVLSPREMKALGWGKQFPGSVEAYRSMRHELTSSEGKKKYEGAQGYLTYAEFHGMDLQKAHIRASAVLSPREMKALGWGKGFPGSVEEFKKILTHFKSESDRRLFTGKEGLKRWTALSKQKTSTKARRQVQVVLSKEEFEELDW